MTSHTAIGAEIERPQSIVSMTTATSINDFDDSLSNVTTPRGTPRGTPRSTSPNHLEWRNSDAPPSYDESQASQHIQQTPWQYQSNAYRTTSDITVYRTETSQHPFSPAQASVDTVNTYGVNDHFTTQDGTDPMLGDQPRASALLHHALNFTNSPFPPRDNNFVAPVSRPVAIPSIRSGPYATDSPVQFARLYARILQTASINAAEFASFIDGLNALCTATSFSSSGLANLRPYGQAIDVPYADIARSEWISAYLHLCNTRFFAPRGLQLELATLAQLADMARLPDARGFKDDMCHEVLKCSVNTTVSDESMLDGAKQAATVLEPYIEPLTVLIPAIHRDSEAMSQIAIGLANFSVDDKASQEVQHQNSRRSINQDLPQSDAAAILNNPDPSSRIWPTPLANIPLSLGPLLPGRLPPRTIRSTSHKKPSWHEWGDDFGKRMEQWGVDYGKKWEEWGNNYGKAWQNWADEVSKKSSGRQYGPCSTQVMMANACATRAQNTASSSSVNAEGVEHEHDWDDGSSILTDSSSSSSDSESTVVEDPEAIFAEKVAKTEDMAKKAVQQGKKAPAVIEQERIDGIRKAVDEKSKREQRLEYRLRRRELKHYARLHKRQVMHWKRAYKRDIKEAKRQRLPRADLQAITAQRTAEMAQMQCRWEEVRAEIEQMKFDLRTACRQTRAELKAQRTARTAQMQQPYGRDRGFDGRHDEGNAAFATTTASPHVSPTQPAPHVSIAQPSPIVSGPFSRVGPGLHFGRVGPLAWNRDGWHSGRGGAWGRWHHQHPHQHPHHHLHHHQYHHQHHHGRHIGPQVWPYEAHAHIQHVQDTGVVDAEIRNSKADEMLWIVIRSLE